MCMAGQLGSIGVLQSVAMHSSCHCAGPWPWPSPLQGPVENPVKNPVHRPGLRAAQLLRLELRIDCPCLGGPSWHCGGLPSHWHSFWHATSLPRAWFAGEPPRPPRRRVGGESLGQGSHALLLDGAPDSLEARMVCKSVPPRPLASQLPKWWLQGGGLPRQRLSALGGWARVHPVGPPPQDL